MHPKPKKRLGQNFLIDGNILRKIISACQITSSDVILEIGSGRGELTGLLSENAGMVYALELDTALSDLLGKTLEGSKNLKIINRDILKLDLLEYFKDVEGRIKVIGNIPYYISTPIISYLLKYKEKIDTIFITVQKEFAKRVVSLPGPKEYGSLSCFVQYYACPKILFSIKNTCFFPVPKVDSAFLRLAIRRHPGMPVKSERMLFKIIRTAFNQRRKVLKNSLSGVVSSEKLTRFFELYSIDKNIRPEELSLQDFLNLANL